MIQRTTRLARAFSLGLFLTLLFLLLFPTVQARSEGSLLVAHWNFEQGDIGTDRGPNSLHLSNAGITNNTNSTMTPNGWGGSYFQLAKGWRRTQDDNLLDHSTDWAYSFDILCNSSDGNRYTIFSKGSSAAAGGMSAFIRMDAIQHFAIRADVGFWVWYNSTVDVCTNSRVHIVVQEEGGSIQLYKNSVSQTPGISNDRTVSNSHEFRLGIKGVGSSLPLLVNASDIILSNFRRYNDSLTLIEIDYLYNNNSWPGGGYYTGPPPAFLSSFNISYPFRSPVPSPGLNTSNLTISTFINSSGSTTLSYFFNSSFYTNRSATNGTINMSFTNLSEGVWNLEVRMFDNQGLHTDTLTGILINRTWVNLIYPANNSQEAAGYVDFNYTCNGSSNSILSAYITLNGTVYTNTSSVTLGNVYGQQIWLNTIDTYDWTVSCQFYNSSWGAYNETSSTSSFDVFSIMVNISARDEDSDALITGEQITFAVYDLSNILLDLVNTTDGTAQIELDGNIDYIIVAYSNETYINQRRLLFHTGEDPSENVSIYLLQDGLGSINYFDIIDDSTGLPIVRAEVLIQWSNKTIDYGITDSDGRFISYLDPYKLYNVQATFNGYNTNSVSFYGSSLTVHSIDLSLTRLPTINDTSIWFTPISTSIKENQTAYMRVHIDGWKTIDYIYIVVSDTLDLITSYEATNLTLASHSLAFFWNLSATDTASWCNASNFCYGDSNTVSWLVMNISLNDFGTSGHVYAKAYATTYQGEEIIAARTGWLLDTRGAIDAWFHRFSNEQRHLIGLVLVILFTGAGSGALDKRRSMSFRQAGWVAVLSMVGVTLYGLWEIYMLVVPILTFVSLIAWRETS